MTALSPVVSDRVRPSSAEASELAEFLETLGRFERGEIDGETWRSYRVARGVYSQRQDGVHMVRVRIPQGRLTAEQLRALAEVTQRWSRGFGHLTTRENLQLDFVRPSDLGAVLERLGEVGITTRGAGGNTVRNVVTCPLAGVAEDEVFDPTPYAEAVTRTFLRHPLTSSLPRKFKIGFEGCRSADHVGGAIQDLGFRAVLREEHGVERRGFAVTVGGGTSSACTAGAPLYDFFPAAELLLLVEAILRVFHQRGERNNKHRSRLKFLVRELGLEGFRRLVEAALEGVRGEGGPRLPFDPERGEVEEAPRHRRPSPPSPEAIANRVGIGLPVDFGETPRLTLERSPSAAARALFLATNVRAQRQAGFRVVTVVAPQGDVTAAQLEVLGELSLAYGDGVVRLGVTGHLVMRWVKADEVDDLYQALAAAGLGRAGAGSAADVVSCPGAGVCRMAVTRTRGVARLIEEHMRARGPEGLEVPLSVHVSGCPNGCSQHHVAAIGLQGSARRLAGRSVPQYFVLLGGELTPGEAHFGKIAAKLPARRLPEAVDRLVALYVRERLAGEAAGAFFRRAHAQAVALLAPLEALTLEESRAEDFVEPGAVEPFRPETQAGECAA